MDSYFEKGVKLKGTLWVKGAVHFDGEMEGDVHSSNHFVVGKTGSVCGTVNSYNVSNMGRIEGDIVAENKVTLLQDSSLKGDITTYHLVIDEGSNFEGSSRMTGKKPKEVSESKVPEKPKSKEDIAREMIEKDTLLKKEKKAENKEKASDTDSSSSSGKESKGWSLKGWGSKTGLFLLLGLAGTFFFSSAL